MFNDNAFPNAGSITGSGGAQITGSGIFLYLDYGQPYLDSVRSYYIYQTGILTGVSQSVENSSITGSGGAQITGSGIYLYLDYMTPYINGVLLQTESPDSGTPTPPSPTNFFKPYAFFYKKR